MPLELATPPTATTTSSKSRAYEEYHPYGTTAYRATDSQTEVSAKRYRYTGKEKDEETGLYYHGARYYACWLGRWTAADPAGLGDGNNRFRYVGNNPTSFQDSSGGRKEPSSVAKLALGIGRAVATIATGDPDTAEKLTNAASGAIAQRQSERQPKPPITPENREFLARKNRQVIANQATRAVAGDSIVSDANVVAQGAQSASVGTPTGINAGQVAETAAQLLDAGDFLQVVPNPVKLLENPGRELAENTPFLRNFVGFQESTESAATRGAEGDRIGAGFDLLFAGLEAAEAIGAGSAVGQLASTAAGGTGFLFAPLRGRGGGGGGGGGGGRGGGGDATEKLFRAVGEGERASLDVEKRLLIPDGEGTKILTTERDAAAFARQTRRANPDLKLLEVEVPAGTTKRLSEALPTVVNEPPGGFTTSVKQPIRSTRGGGERFRLDQDLLDQLEVISLTIREFVR